MTILVNARERLVQFMELRICSPRIWKELMEYLFVYELLVKATDQERVSFHFGDVSDGDGTHIKQSAYQWERLRKKIGTTHIHPQTVLGVLNSVHDINDKMLSYIEGVGKPLHLFSTLELCLHPLNLAFNYIVEKEFKEVDPYSSRKKEDVFDLHTFTFLLRHHELNHFDYFSNAPYIMINENDYYDNCDFQFPTKTDDSVVKINSGRELVVSEIKELHDKYYSKWTLDYFKSIVLKLESPELAISNAVNIIHKLIGRRNFDTISWIGENSELRNRGFNTGNYKIFYEEGKISLDEIISEITDKYKKQDVLRSILQTEYFKLDFSNFELIIAELDKTAGEMFVLGFYKIPDGACDSPDFKKYYQFIENSTINLLKI